MKHYSIHTIHNLVLLYYNIGDEVNQYREVYGARKIQENIILWKKHQDILTESNLSARHLVITITLTA